MNKTGLLEPQKGHVDVLLSALMRHGYAWDASHTGTGKTYVASALARHLNKKVVVICPKLVIPIWEKILASFGVKAHIICNYEKLCRGNTKWLKYGKVKKDEDPIFSTKLKFPKDCFVILDESHKCKGVTSLNAGLMMALKRDKILTLLASATQACSPLDMRAFGFMCGLHDGTMKEYKKFCIQTGAKWKGHHGAMFFDEEDDSAKQKMMEVHEYLHHNLSVGSRLTKKDFNGIFPDNQIVVESYDMGANSDKIDDVYNEMEYELDRLEEQSENYKNHILAIITKARRQVELLKVPTMVEMVVDLYREGKSPIVFVNYKETIAALVDRVGKEIGLHLVAQIHGDQSFKERYLDIELFQKDVKRVTIANSAAGGQSISLHDLNGNFPRGSIINPSFSAIQIIQSMGRHDRAYAKTDCYTRFLYAARTIEDNVCRRFQFKKDNLDLLNDGDLIPSERLFNLVKGKTI